MPRTILDEAPEVDELKALILERKLAYGFSWADIAEKAHCNPDVLRAMMSKKHTERWNPDIRRGVCRALGINQKTVFQVEVLK